MHRLDLLHSIGDCASPVAPGIGRALAIFKRTHLARTALATVCAVATTLAMGATVPGAPTIGTATSGNAQATVTFTPPSSNGGATITSYTVTSNPGAKTKSGSGSPITVTGLTNGTAYTFTVTATNSVGTGPASRASNGVKPATVPGAPTIGTATRGNASAVVAFTVPSSNGGSPITSYAATSTPGGKTGTGTSSPISVAGLTNGTAYTFQVTATNAVGTGAASAASNSVTPATVPGAPTIGTATGGNTQTSVAFTSPSSNGGAPITSYAVTSIPGSKTGIGTASPIVVTGLTNGTAYTFKVTATNSAGTSSASAASNSVTPATVPGAPTIGTATAGNGRASVGFSAPTSNGGSAITNYTATASPSGLTASGTTSPISVTGLTNATAYTFTVTATNSVGTGAASAASNSVTPDAAPSVTITGPSSGATGTAPATFSLTATASVAASGETISGVQYYANGTAIGGAQTTSPYSYTWANVASGTYTITATATDNFGTVGTSAPVSVTVSNPPPTISLTSPQGGSTIIQGAVVPITATATAPGGTVASVQFFDGSTLLGAATASGSTYTYNWATSTSTAPGNHSLSAKVTDGAGDVVASNNANVTVQADVAPYVSITAPTGITTGLAPGSVSFTAYASVYLAGETISGVQYFAGGVAISPVLTTAPYAFTWTNIPAGNSSVTAKATDNYGTTGGSSPHTVILNNPTLTVSITSPGAESSFAQGEVVALTASTWDQTATVSGVQFFDGATFIGNGVAAGSTYSLNWATSASTASGSHSITATVSDSLGGTGTSAARLLTIVSFNAPTVSITAPTTGQNIYSGTPLTLTATATPNQGAIASVQFLDGTTLIGTASQSGSAFSLVWPNPTQGSHTIVAKATDTYGESATSSQAVTVLAGTPGTGIYYVYADQIDAPRMIVRAVDNQTVWQWNIADPFGASAPNGNPAGLGQYTYNPRLPGQLNDFETGVYYNISRTYDPSIGRYVQSDPIGLRGGLNTYIYVNGSPLSYLDPMGLWCVSQAAADAISAGGGGFVGGLVASGGNVGVAAISAGIGAATGYALSGTGPLGGIVGGAAGGLSGAAGGGGTPGLVGGTLAGALTGALATSTVPDGDSSVNNTVSGFLGGLAGGFAGGLLTPGRSSLPFTRGLLGGLGGAAGGFTQDLLNLLLSSHLCKCGEH
jgi:RHS repeat-associated protein